ncbi:MAG: hypothetical protein KJO26_15615 [Deltaproteobacteria bacterium]|nr:hypothetical protein [Deltaproteobacteria bacterium]NNK84661.1 hypothetical protein [Desulfobacterales bacterium]
MNSYPGELISARYLYIDILKEPIFEGDIVKDLICYCFGYSIDDVEKDYKDNGVSTIMEKIQMEKRFGNCQCATKNPKGK